MKKVIGLMLILTLLLCSFPCFTYAADNSEYEFINIDKLGKFDVNRNGNGYFGVNDNIAYEHFALLLARLFGYDAENKENSSAVREDIIVSVVKALNMDVAYANEGLIDKVFSDCGDLKPENRKYIAAAIESGLVVGYDGKLFPVQKLTRAETVVLLYRAISKGL